MKFQDYYIKENTIADNPNFMKWFKGSKVVDKNGNPLIVYHGTDKSFNSFKNMGGKVITIFGDAPVKRQGFFFTPSINAAKEFGKNIISVYLNIKKPFDLVDGDIDLMLDELEKNGINRRWIEKTDQWELFDGEDGEELIKVLKKIGYDGVIFMEPNAGVNRGGKSYIAFESSQVKSATDNNGDFNLNSDNIYEERKNNV